MSSPTPQQLNGNSGQGRSLKLDIDSVRPEMIVIRAGAGAGKTTELVRRVLGLAQHLHQEKKSWPHIVVTTFTRKATQELKERLQKKAMELENQFLIEYVQKQSYLHISTIHGVLSVFLARYGSKIGLAPQFSLVDDRIEENQIKKILRNLLDQPKLAEKIEFLLEEQPARNLISNFQRYYNLRAETQGKISILSGAEMREEVGSFVDRWCEQADNLSAVIAGNYQTKTWIEYAGILASTLAELGRAKDVVQKCQIIASFHKQKITVRVKTGDDSTAELKSDLQQVAKMFHEQSWLYSEKGFQNHQALAANFLELAELVCVNLLNQKIQSSQITMNDLEVLSLELIKKNPESASHFSQDWDYWFVDEYQDTSPRQVQLLKALIGDRNNFTVGDPQQSIYYFRGSRSEVFLDKENEVLESQGTTAKKMENYRSRPALLRFFNLFFRKLGSQFSEMMPSAKDFGPAAEKFPVANFFECAPQSENQPDNQEIVATVNQCISLIDQGVKPEEISVLCRSHRIIKKIADACSSVHLPVQIHASNQFYFRREIQDSLALLKFFVNTNDNVNFIELIRSPWFRVSDRDIVKIAEQKNNNYWSVAIGLFPSDPVLAKLSRLIISCNEIGVVRVWEKALFECGIFEFSAQLDPSGQREANLWKLMAELKNYEKTPGFSVLEFAQKSELANLDTEGAGSADATPVIEPNRVNLMTIHGSKGLEFEHVIIPEMGAINISKKNNFVLFDETRKKITMSLMDPGEGKLTANLVGDRVLEIRKEREFEEYDRLLYVAMTRAKHSVSLIWSKADKNSWANRMWKPTIEKQDLEGGEINFYPNYCEKVKQLEKQLVKNIQPISRLAGSSVMGDIGQSVTDLVNEKDKSKPAPAEEKLKTSDVDSLKRNLELAQFGTDIHRIFESIHYQGIQTQGLSEKQMAAVNFIREWNQGEIVKWIEKGEVEWGFCILEKNQWLQGQIDLWYQCENGEVIIADYKTGSTNHSEKAFQQMQIYAWALRRMKKVSDQAKIKMVAIYPFSKKVIERTFENNFSL